MKVYWNAQSTDNSMQIVTNSILDMADTQGMAYRRMEKTNIGSGVNPAFDCSCRRRMVTGEANINYRRPFCFLLRKSGVWLGEWKYLARKFQGQSTCIDQSFGTFTKTGSGSPFCSAFATASS